MPIWGHLEREESDDCGWEKEGGAFSTHPCMSSVNCLSKRATAVFSVCSLEQKWTTANRELIGMTSGAYKIQEELRNRSRARILKYLVSVRTEGCHGVRSSPARPPILSFTRNPEGRVYLARRGRCTQLDGPTKTVHA